jgi:hypothetical protein
MQMDIPKENKEEVMIRTELNEDQCNGNTTASVYVDGMGTKVEEEGAPMYLERNQDGGWTLYVWADINKEGPTHVIDMTQALEVKLTKEGE